MEATLTPAAGGSTLELRADEPFPTASSIKPALGSPFRRGLPEGVRAISKPGSPITQLSEAIHSTFHRLARSSEYGRTVSERDAGR
jgi:hypothetical protein